MTVFGPLGASLAPYITKNRGLYNMIKPIADWYANASGYRKYGFKYDDLIVSERPDVERAIARLTPRERYDRAFRMKRASQCSVLHEPLPKDQWTKPEEDVRYLTPHIEDVVREDQERAKWDTMAVERKR
ncbi:ubiquinol-cytochrome-c reductase complex subunit 6 [Epithele typhae]|uniref:ubiquinol-cytochrome-c reductase complex subunit 6 n=1 Tax=Epithele typhae TaxID=378194 RepID=UPI002007DE10|nr:ubiquinol-cytochrome-c reductase complex subunit 6 [Epithele typhae]KAH9946311.1 ubiquinol-cytochrome-c reductase complex subunit 6 [Epithele typhae]